MIVVSQTLGGRGYMPGSVFLARCCCAVLPFSCVAPLKNERLSDFRRAFCLLLDSGVIQYPRGARFDTVLLLGLDGRLEGKSQICGDGCVLVFGYVP